MENERLPPLDDETNAIINRWRNSCFSDHTRGLAGNQFKLMCRSCTILMVDEILKPRQIDQKAPSLFARMFGYRRTGGE